MRCDATRRHLEIVRWVFVLFAFCLTGCQRSVELPVEVSGTYVTRHPTYQDRSFTLTPDNFLVHLEETDSVRYPIRDVYFEPNGHGPHMDLYTVVYANDSGQEYKLRFYLEPDSRKALVFSNQPGVVWTRKDGES